jgi:uncharacterized membrane protein YcaP (DUF421 family)
MNWTAIFDGWSSVLRTVVVGVLAYIALVTLLRVSGKRTLSKLNAFDLVVTVALGSTLASTLLSKQTSLASGITAMLVLIGMQFAVTWLSIRSAKVRKAARSEPRLLVWNGHVIDEASRAERITEDEILEAIRSDGHAALRDVHAVVLETDGTLSVIGSASAHEGATFGPVTGYPRS